MRKLRKDLPIFLLDAFRLRIPLLVVSADPLGLADHVRSLDPLRSHLDRSDDVRDPVFSTLKD